MPTQLRIYTIQHGALQDFAEEWKAKIKPLRLKLGFRVPAAWIVEAADQFVWLMRYDGPEDWEAVDQAYFQSEERKAMQPDPARYIARSEQYFVEPVE
jgi:hypothetical protein